MSECCPECWRDKGVSSILYMDKSTGNLQCAVNIAHTFSLDRNGFLHTVKK